MSFANNARLPRTARDSRSGTTGHGAAAGSQRPIDRAGQALP